MVLTIGDIGVQGIGRGPGVVVVRIHAVGGGVVGLADHGSQAQHAKASAEVDLALAPEETVAADVAGVHRHAAFQHKAGAQVATQVFFST